MENMRRLTGSQLKLIAMVSMFIDHLAAAVLLVLIENAYYVRAPLSQWTLQHIDALITLYELMRYIGRFAFPIYCFLLVEGFTHTRSVPKYALRLGIFSLVSELPFDLALNYSPLEFSSNNVFFTLLLGLLSIWAIAETVKRFSDQKVLLGILVVLAAGCGSLLAEYLFKCDYGAAGVLAIVVIYLLRKYPVPAFLAAVGVLSIGNTIELYALFMVLPIALYSGERGRKMKLGPYLFYPLHLLLFFSLTFLLFQ